MAIDPSDEGGDPPCWAHLFDDDDPVVDPGVEVTGDAAEATEPDVGGHGVPVDNG